MMSPTLPQSHLNGFGPMYPSPSHWNHSSPSHLRADSATFSPSYRQMSPSIQQRTLYSESHQQQQQQQQQFPSQPTPKRSPYHHPRSVVTSTTAAMHHQQQQMQQQQQQQQQQYRGFQHDYVDDADRLVTDSYMESHSIPTAGEDADNLFDFVLLPGVMNARRGMKIAAPETIPCKYGNTCFRRDCRFAHSGSIDETTGLASRDTSPTRSSASSAHHHAHHSSYSSSRARSPSTGYYSSSSSENSPASEPSTPPRHPSMQDFAIML